jgi:hypothetical protein
MRPSGSSIQVVLPHLSVLDSIPHCIARYLVAVAVDQFAPYQEESIRTVFPYTKRSAVFFLGKKVKNIFMVDFEARYTDVELYLRTKNSKIN